MRSLTDLKLPVEVTKVRKVVQEAALPTNRSDTPLSRNIALGLWLGLMAGLGLALLADLKTVPGTSPDPAEGKSSTSYKLALALSSVSRQTVLLDVGFRRARVHQIFDIDQMPSMSDVVLNGVARRSVAYSVQDPGLKDISLSCRPERLLPAWQRLLVFTGFCPYWMA